MKKYQIFDFFNSLHEGQIMEKHMKKIFRQLLGQEKKS